MSFPPEVVEEFESSLERDVTAWSDALEKHIEQYERGLEKGLFPRNGSGMPEVLPDFVEGLYKRGPAKKSVLDENIESNQTFIKAGNGVMIAWFPPAEVAQQLAREDGEEPKELHVTLLYLGRDLEEDEIDLLQDRVATFAARYAPLQGEIGGIGRFPASDSSDGSDVLIRLVDIPRLESLREELIGVVRELGIEPVLSHGYTPHMTVAYVDPEFRSECAQPQAVPITLDALTVTVGEERERFLLNGEEVLKANPCHEPAGSSAGGQFCSSKERVVPALSAQLTDEGRVKHKRVSAAVETLSDLPFDERIVSSRPVSLRVDKSMRGSENDGVYSGEYKLISLSPTVRVDTVVHEYGHHLDRQWFQGSQVVYAHEKFRIDTGAVSSLRAGMMEEFRHARTKNGIKSTGENWSKGYEVSSVRALRAPSAYALKDRQEWFAEAFILYAKNPKALEKRLPKTYKAVDGVVRGTFLTETAP